jgi:hypothetical protein
VIDDVSIYNRVITAEEAQARFLRGCEVLNGRTD